MNETESFQIQILNTFICQKLGEDISDCQDSLSTNINNNRFCVADGVSRSFYPAIFSGLLTNLFCNGDMPENTELFSQKKWQKWLEIAQHEWLKLVEEKVDQTNKYYIKNRFYNKEHAGATFAGIEFQENERSIIFNAMIIGDSCIIHIDQAHKKTNKYLIESSKDFNFTPNYFPSRPVQEKSFQPNFLIDQPVSVDDIIVVATDAIAKWLLLLIEKREKLIFNDIHKLTYETIDKYRTDQSYPLENDDIALLVLKVVQPKQKG